MKERRVISIVLSAHIPFVREYSAEEDLFPRGAEGWLFDAISETYLPLLEVFSRLEKDNIPFRLAMCFSPVLCCQLLDDMLIKKYLNYMDRQIEFGRCELERTAGLPEEDLAKRYFERARSLREAFSDRYECNILKALDRKSVV
jgi:1,4-alpha-glucan branching enzyme